MSDYTPILCALHDSYELACMRNLVDLVIWQNSDGHILRQKLRYLTINTCNGEEFLLAADENGTQLRIRLDMIQSTPPGS